MQLFCLTPTYIFLLKSGEERVQFAMPVVLHLEQVNALHTHVAEPLLSSLNLIGGQGRGGERREEGGERDESEGGE